MPASWSVLGLVPDTVGNCTESTTVDGINLDEIKEFARQFKIRRLSLGLTQTQVGQALSATEGPAYSQSAICRWGHAVLHLTTLQTIWPQASKTAHTTFFPFRWISFWPQTTAWEKVLNICPPPPLFHDLLASDHNFCRLLTTSHCLREPLTIFLLHMLSSDTSQSERTPCLSCALDMLLSNNKQFSEKTPTLASFLTFFFLGGN